LAISVQAHNAFHRDSQISQINPNNLEESNMSNKTKRALIVIDVQNEYVTGNLRIEYPPVQESLANIGAAMDVAKAAGIPIVVVQHDTPAGTPIFAVGSEGWKLHPTVASRPYDHLINKTMASAITDTDLETWLTANNINTLTVVGYMTHNCNASTILQASHAGYKVEFLHDAGGSLPYENDGGAASAEEIHRVFTVVFQTGFAAVQTTAQWVESLETGEARASSGVYTSNQQALRRLSKAA
jgi:nicotinamidase-related amidase